MKQLFRTKLIRTIEWVISIGMSGILALAVDSNIPNYWGSKVFIRLIIFLLTTIVFSMIFEIGFSYIIRKAKFLSPVKFIILISCTVLVSYLISYLGYGLTINMPSEAFRETGELISRITYVAFIFFIRPVFFIFFVLAWKDKNTVIPKWDNQKLYQRIYITMCLAALLVPFIGAGNYRNIEQTFWGREWLLRKYSDIRVLVKDTVFDSSMIGRNNWLIFTGENSIDDFQNTIPFSKRDLEEIQVKLDKLAYHLSEKGVKSLIVIIPPNKNTIYPEYIPAEISIIGQKSRLDQIVDYQKQSGEEKILDVRPVLLSSKNQNLVYYQTDTHWNPLGAFLAYKEIMKEVQKTFPHVKEQAIEDFKYVPREFIGGISKNMIRSDISEMTFYLVPVQKQNITTSFEGSSLKIMENPDSDLPNLVMFGDSFSPALVPFLSNSFSRFVLVSSFIYNEKFIETENPDVVIIELTERHLDMLKSLPK